MRWMERPEGDCGLYVPALLLREILEGEPVDRGLNGGLGGLVWCVGEC